MSNKKEIIFKKNTKNRTLLILNLFFLLFAMYSVNKNELNISFTLVIIITTILVVYYLFIKDKQIIVYKERIILKNANFNTRNWEIEIIDIKHVQISYLRDTLISRKLIDFYCQDSTVKKCSLEGLYVADLEIVFQKVNLKVIKKIIKPR